MKLEIFASDTRNRVDMIRTYNFVQYLDEFNGMGSFSIILPTNDESIVNLIEGNFIYFDDGVMGVIKGIRTSQDSDVEIEVYGFLTNFVLSQRVFEKTKKYYDTVPVIARNMVSDKFINVGNEYRKISAVTLSAEPEYFPVFDEKITFQNTGDTVFQAMSELFLTYNLGVEMYPIIANYSEDNPVTNLKALEFRILKPHDRTINNKQGNPPVVFSFDLNNLSRLDYEEDARTHCNVVYVASEGAGQDRNVIEVGEKESAGFSRIEGYQDARDLQTQSNSGGGSGSSGGNTGGEGGSGTGTVVGGAFEVAKWELVTPSELWTQVNDVTWKSEVATTVSNTATTAPISFAINVPDEFVVNPRIVASQYMRFRVTVNGVVVVSKTDVTSSYNETPDIPLRPGVNNIVFERWVAAGPTNISKIMTIYLYDFAADINTEGYLTTTADIWRPSVDEAGDVSWTKSATTTAPQTRNIKGPKGEQGISPHIDPETGHWMVGSIDTNVKADGIDGTTPHIDTATGNWFIGVKDTGVHAQGPQGPQGPKGEPGAPGKPDLPFQLGIDNSGEYGYYKNDTEGNTTDEFVPFGTGSGSSGGHSLFKFEMREDGCLWLITDDPIIAEKFYINDNGELIYRLR